eukprot:gnl/TRDRNA2_/TRDRNA2_155111_c0_seq1.p1 gnl/TRDRNA2_/TRDRNA2_155111_c0~~gnl/TRDRNA2_/TRDRNA2_155111_c0_seq1.p1  ORF type:complete len:265 (-),score=21.38 gnl/TRDRNA2_/TRDRNA2_155111_c0_seq1:105-899(-)
MIRPQPEVIVGAALSPRMQWHAPSPSVSHAAFASPTQVAHWRRPPRCSPRPRRLEDALARRHHMHSTYDDNGQLYLGLYRDKVEKEWRKPTWEAAAKSSAATAASALASESAREAQEPKDIAAASPSTAGQQGAGVARASAGGPSGVGSEVRTFVQQGDFSSEYLEMKALGALYDKWRSSVNSAGSTKEGGLGINSEQRAVARGKTMLSLAHAGRSVTVMNPQEASAEPPPEGSPQNSLRRSLSDPPRACRRSFLDPPQWGYAV